jgi:hypothetical protein
LGGTALAQRLPPRQGVLATATKPSQCGSPLGQSGVVLRPPWRSALPRTPQCPPKFLLSWIGELHGSQVLTQTSQGSPGFDWPFTHVQHQDASCIRLGIRSPFPLVGGTMPHTQRSLPKGHHTDMLSSNGLNENCNDPAAGSPTATLLRLLLPLAAGHCPISAGSARCPRTGGPTS